MFPVKGEKLFQPWTTWNKSSRQSGQTDLHELQNSSPVPLSHSSCITTVVIHHDGRAWLKPTWLTNIVTLFNVELVNMVYGERGVNRGM